MSTTTESPQAVPSATVPPPPPSACGPSSSTSRHEVAMSQKGIHAEVSNWTNAHRLSIESNEGHGTVPAEVKSVPAGMTEVTEEVFWEHVMGEKRDVMPYPEKYETIWRLNNGNRQPWGWVSEGYAGPFEYRKDAPPKRFALARVEGRS